MPITAGQKIRASDLNNITHNTLAAQATADQTVTTAQVDVTSATITFTTPLANTVVNWHAVFRVTHNGTADTFVGIVELDGVDQPEQAVLNGVVSATLGQHGRVVVASAGAHTIKLQILKFGTTNVVTMNAAATRLTIGGLGIT